MSEPLAAPCPFCGAAMGEHDLEGLALCVLEGLGDDVEDVEGPTLRLVL